ncbi:tRNA adenosine(34) deaminase TadA [Acinetobacter sp. MD2(2019)]|uniref:tRNA adenosine(34) deaminase TadA n=1 Tax=Acinetobacter sp. MD2(2019) TaxID=2605273 RepID=UPI002D1E7469|nr:tRNA adenosine(34) deaminase TadA [Acinetobacter sp. MD2(2019)]MEB3752826.1 tRNA adenosine(34) deaminase TadA [Acinetobacter sp. MD2(2019)]
MLFNQLHDPSSFSEEDKKWMRLALVQAYFAQTQNEIPVGAVIVSQNKVIGVGYNAPIGLNDPTAHAEIMALRDACASLDNYRLPEDAVLYVTLEPCTMCVGALVHARVQKVIFAASEPKAGSLLSARQLLNNNGYYNHVFEYQAGCLAEESTALLSTFFKTRRAAKKRQLLEMKKNN